MTPRRAPEPDFRTPAPARPVVWPAIETAPAAPPSPALGRAPDALDGLLARAVTQRAQARPAGGLLQRKVVSKRAPDAALDDTMRDLDAIVQEAYWEVLSEPLAPALERIDGYTRRWLALFRSFRATQDRAFLHAAFGYAVESVAGSKMGRVRLPRGHTLALQVGRGPTRPDIVVKRGRYEHVAWFDITSSASEGHILRKMSTLWTTIPYVAEITYPTLDPALLGLGSLDSRQREQALKSAAEMSTIREKMAARIERLRRELPAPLPGHNKADKKRDIETQLGPLLGLDGKAPPRLAKGVLILAGRRPGDYGYTGASAGGRDTELARELVYGEAVLRLREGDEHAFNLNLLSHFADSQPPVTGLPPLPFLDELDTTSFPAVSGSVPFVSSFASPPPRVDPLAPRPAYVGTHWTPTVTLAGLSSAAMDTSGDDEEWEDPPMTMDADFDEGPSSAEDLLAYLTDG